MRGRNKFVLAVFAATAASLTIDASAQGRDVLVLALGTLLGRMSWQLTQSRRREAEAKIAHAERVEYLAYHDGLTRTTS